MKAILIVLLVIVSLVAANPVPAVSTDLKDLLERVIQQYDSPEARLSLKDLSKWFLAYGEQVKEWVLEFIEESKKVKSFGGDKYELIQKLKSLIEAIYYVLSYTDTATKYINMFKDILLGKLEIPNDILIGKRSIEDYEKLAKMLEFFDGPLGGNSSLALIDNQFYSLNYFMTTWIEDFFTKAKKVVYESADGSVLVEHLDELLNKLDEVVTSLNGFEKSAEDLKNSLED